MSGNRQQLQVATYAYPSQGQIDALVAPSNMQLLVHSFSACNNSGSSQDMGLGIRLAPQAWNLYSIVAATSNVTASVQAGSAVTILGTTNNYGFIIQAKEPFGKVSFNISQAQTGSPTYTYQYWNGSAWATLGLYNTPAYTATGYGYINFPQPLDWAQGSGGVTTAMATGLGYCIRVLGTTAPSTAVQINAMQVGKWLAYRKTVLATAELQVRFPERALLLENGEALAPFFTTANAVNTVEFAYQVNG